MRKYIGKVTVKNSNSSFPIMWDIEEQTSWLGLKSIPSSGLIWKQICKNVTTVEDVLSCAQTFVDLQYGGRY